jgi:hypothetical protein
MHLYSFERKGLILKIMYFLFHCFKMITFFSYTLWNIVLKYIYISLFSSSLCDPEKSEHILSPTKF